MGINWEFYENNISNKALVADFKAKFEATEIPVPSDEGLAAKLEARAVEDEAAVAASTMNNLKALPPFEQMTSQDILYWFPQLCRNQEWIAGSENTPTSYIGGAQFNETGWFEHPGVLKAHLDRQQERVGADDGSDEWRLEEKQFPEGKFPDFFSRFPTEDFKE